MCQSRHVEASGRTLVGGSAVASTPRRGCIPLLLWFAPMIGKFAPLAYPTHLLEAGNLAGDEMRRRTRLRKLCITFTIHGLPREAKVGLTQQYTAVASG